LGLDCSVVVEEQDPDHAAIVKDRAGRKIDDAVAVEIAETRHRNPEPVAVGELSVESSRGRADLLVRFHGRIAIEEQDPDRTAVEPAVVILTRADREVGHAVAVEIAERRDGSSEDVAIAQAAAEIAGRITDLVLVGDFPILVEHQQPDGAAIRSAVVIESRADDEVVVAVVVEIAERRDRKAEPVVIVERTVKAARSHRDLLRRRAVTMVAVAAAAHDEKAEKSREESHEEYSRRCWPKRTTRCRSLRCMP